MKTFILIADVHNNDTYPIGTIVKYTGDNYRCFEVVEGDQKGEVMAIASGPNKWVVEDTPENRAEITVNLGLVDHYSELSKMHQRKIWEMKTVQF